MPKIVVPPSTKIFIGDFIISYMPPGKYGFWASIRLAATDECIATCSSKKQWIELYRESPENFLETNLKRLLTIHKKKLKRMADAFTKQGVFLSRLEAGVKSL